jgi:hypothetical protein
LRKDTGNGHDRGGSWKNKSLLLLFFKKEGLSCFSASLPKANTEGVQLP